MNRRIGELLNNSLTVTKCQVSRSTEKIPFQTTFNNLQKKDNMQNIFDFKKKKPSFIMSFFSHVNDS